MSVWIESGSSRIVATICLLALVLTGSPVAATPGAAQDNAARLRQHALDLGPGAPIVITTADGRQIRTVVRAVSDDRIIVDDRLNAGGQTAYLLRQLRGIKFAVSRYKADGTPDVPTIRRIVVTAGLGGQVRLTAGSRKMKGAVVTIGDDGFTLQLADMTSDVAYREVSEIQAGGSRLHPAVTGAIVGGVGAFLGVMLFWWLPYCRNEGTC